MTEHDKNYIFHIKEKELCDMCDALNEALADLVAKGPGVLRDFEKELYGPKTREKYSYDKFIGGEVSKEELEEFYKFEEEVVHAASDVEIAFDNLMRLTREVYDLKGELTSMKDDLRTIDDGLRYKEMFKKTLDKTDDNPSIGEREIGR